MTDTSIARSYARRARRGEYLEIDGGHFVLIEDRAQIREALGAWIRERRQAR